MNRHSRLGLTVAVVAASLLLFSATAWADAASYSPATKTVTGTQPFSNNFDLTITSPAKLTGTSSTPFPSGGVDVEVRVTVDDKPDGVADSTALSMLTLDSTESGASCTNIVPGSGTCTLHFTAFSQGRVVNVKIDVFSSTTPGDYQFTIKTNNANPSGGWGHGDGTILSVSVSAPVAVDDTPPIVVITSPADNSTFGYCSDGVSVGIVFNAQDAESAISSVAADVNGVGVDLTSITGLNSNEVDASGSYLATAIGAYTVTAEATSQGGTGSNTANFSVNYSIGWLPPLSLGKLSKGGSTIPIKFSARDCNGVFVHDESVAVAVFEVTSGGDVNALSGIFGEGASSIRIDDVAGQYIINFQTASGAHNYRVDVYFNGFNGDPFLQASKTFSVR